MRVWRVTKPFNFAEVMPQLAFTKDKSFSNMLIGDKIYESEQFEAMWVKGYLFWTETVSVIYQRFCELDSTIAETGIGTPESFADYASYAEKLAIDGNDLFLIKDSIDGLYKKVKASAIGGGSGTITLKTGVVPTGDKDGINASFALPGVDSYKPGTLDVYLNGMQLDSGNIVQVGPAYTTFMIVDDTLPISSDSFTISYVKS